MCSVVLSPSDVQTKATRGYVSVVASGYVAEVLICQLMTQG